VALMYNLFAGDSTRYILLLAAIIALCAAGVSCLRMGRGIGVDPNVESPAQA